MNEETNKMSAAQGELKLATILACSLVYLFDGLIHTILGPLAPAIAANLELSPAQMGPVFSANLIGQCLGLMTVPLLVNRLGHRRITLFTLLGFGLFELLVGFAQNVYQLFFLCMMTGYFLGGCLPSCLAIVTLSAPPAKRGLAVTLLFTGYGLGATIAGVVSSAFAASGDWRAASILVGALCLASTLIARPFIIEPASSEADAAPAAKASTLFFAIFARLRLTGTLMLWLLFICMLTINYCLFSWLPTMLVKVGREPSLAATSISIFSLGGIVAALGVGLLIDRFGAIRVLITFLALAGALLFAVGQVLATASTPVLLILLALGGFFFLGAYGGVNVVLTSFYPDWLRAVGIGWTKTVSRAGTILAPVLIGIALTAGVQETLIMSWSLVPIILAIVALAVIATVQSRAPAR
jgi:AAHS family 4-hydroxybenzoate transporter-like MFS transporter